MGDSPAWTIDESLMVLCQKGKVLPEVALEHSPDPKELRRMLGVQGWRCRGGRRMGAMEREGRA
jgi:hypothetical protein